MLSFKFTLLTLNNMNTFTLNTLLGASFLSFTMGIAEENKAQVTNFSLDHHSLLKAELARKATAAKEYHIYYENRSEEPIDVAIRYKAYNGEWQTKGLTTLAPGEKKLMGSSDQKTYYYYAEGSNRKEKKQWKGNHKFAISPSAKNKLAFVKEEIWECYDSRICNTYAVFK